MEHTEAAAATAIVVVHKLNWPEIIEFRYRICDAQ